MNDRDLIAACIARDRKAWDTLVSQLSGLVCNVSRKTLRNYGSQSPDQDAEEIAEEVLTSLLENDCRALKSIGEPWNLSAWLVITTRRRTIDFLRRRRLPTVSLDAETRLKSGNAPIRDVVRDARLAPPPGPEESAEAGESDPRQTALREALADLPARERMMTTLFYLKGKKYREISDALGIPMNSVGPMLVRSLAKLQDKLKQKGVTL